MYKEEQKAAEIDAQIADVQQEIATISGSPPREPVPPLQRLVSLPRMTVPSVLLRPDVPAEAAALSTLKDGLPNLLQAFDWSLKYRLTGDGASLTTLLRQCAQSSPLLILAKVDVLVAAQAGQGEGVHRGFIVGGLASRPLTERDGAEGGTGKWKGTGQSFLCGMALPSCASKRLWPGLRTCMCLIMHACKCREEGGADGEAMRCYGWTRECSCFQICGTREGLAIGGGGEKGYGLWLDTQLQVATSSSCTTYGNPSLLACAGAAPDGKATTGAIQELEVWTFAG